MAPADEAELRWLIRRDAARRLADRAIEEARLASCAGKSSFPSLELAQARAQRRRMNRGGAVHPYRCRFCRFWHLGDRALS